MKHKFLISLIVGAFLVACSLSPQLTLIIVSPTPAFTNVIKGRGVVVTVPDTYVSGYPGSLGYSEEYVVLYAYDTEPGSSGIYTELGIVRIPPSATTSLGREMPFRTLILLVVEDYKVSDRTDIEVDKNCVRSNSECVAIAYTLTQEGVTWRYLEYWVKEGKRVYVLIFRTHISEFPRLYDEFSQIFNSFQVLK